MTQTFTSNDNQPAVHAINSSTGAAILADGSSGGGVAGGSTSDVGVHGSTNSASQSAIFGINDPIGQKVVPDGLNRPAGNGVWGHTRVEKGAGVVGSVEPGLSQAAGVVGIGPTAGRFFGDVEVTGDIRLLGGQDCAEDFDIVNLKDAEPGTVMVLDQSGALEPSSKAYDKKVAGVISGAGDFRPGIVLGKQTSDNPRMPIALLGKVYCKVDARYSPIEVGDLLTTSGTAGHAMKAEDPQKAFGAVIGKALRPLAAGQALVPILIALQ
jgi:hypothetical protein